MFFTSGMTLGYLLPESATKKSADKVPAGKVLTDKAERKETQVPEKSDDRLYELEKAFLTPWHMFY